jgi:hypothetical protein
VAAFALLGLSSFAAVAQAAPTELTVRIEGKEKTLFEGPILTEPHEIRASSDIQPRNCDGTANGAFPTPGPTPTAASADAMEIIGETFDGLWSDGFGDYFVVRWGPDAEDPDAAQFWGVIVNGEMTPVGGCQVQDGAGDEVLWEYDAFSSFSRLRLATAADPSAAPRPPAPTAHVEVDQPLALKVQSLTGVEGETPVVSGAEGVPVAPVQTEAGTGFQTVLVASPLAVTDAAGAATVTFHTTGWHRVKAQRKAGLTRSNRLDVCVEPVGGGGCGPLPTDAQVRRRGSQEGPPPPLPSNAISLGRVRLNREAGTAEIAVRVPGPGQVSLSGRGLRPASRTATATGTVRLPVRALRGARAALRRQGRFRATLTVGFTPTGGTRATLSRALTLRLERDRR